MLSGALVLAVSALFATKANKRFTAVTTGETTNGDVVWKGESLFTTAGNSARKAFVEFCTSGGFVFTGQTPVQLFTAPNHTKPVLFR